MFPSRLFINIRSFMIRSFKGMLDIVHPVCCFIFNWCIAVYCSCSRFAAFSWLKRVWVVSGGIFRQQAWFVWSPNKLVWSMWATMSSTGTYFTNTALHHL